MLEVQNLFKSFGKKSVLKDLSVKLSNGAIALLGPNGAGKTTLLRTILGLYRCQSGSLQLDGEDVTGTQRIAAASGYLPQKFGALPNLSCRDMLQYFALLKNIPKSESKKEIERCLELVNLSDRAKSKCSSLSGGMLRRLGIAQTLLGDPKLLFFDEPTTGLDPEERLRFKLLIHQLSDGHTVVISTHIVDDVEALCGHIVVMENGTVSASLSNQELAKRAQGFVWLSDTNDAAVLPKDSYVRAIREEKGQARFIVLSTEPIGRPLSPTIEDGYLCCIKHIGESHVT